MVSVRFGKCSMGFAFAQLCSFTITISVQKIVQISDILMSSQEKFLTNFSLVVFGLVIFFRWYTFCWNYSWSYIHFFLMKNHSLDVLNFNNGSKVSIRFYELMNSIRCGKCLRGFACTHLHLFTITLSKWNTVQRRDKWNCHRIEQSVLLSRSAFEPVLCEGP